MNIRFESRALYFREPKEGQPVNQFYQFHKELSALGTLALSRLRELYPGVNLHFNVIHDTPYIPEGTPHPEYLLPDSVVDTMARRYGMYSKFSHVIDPLCGYGTIVRRITAGGGRCSGIEIDPIPYGISAREVGRLAPGATLVQGDCFSLANRDDYRNKFTHIYTSPMFAQFAHPDSEEYADDRLGQALFAMVQRGGILVVDSDESSPRYRVGGDQAADTAAYFERNGFKLDTLEIFATRGKPHDIAPPTDTTFAELVFVRL